MVLITYFNDLRAQGQDAVAAALNGARTRLRPVLMTALVAGVGFVPMALSTSPGAGIAAAVRHRGDFRHPHLDRRDPVAHPVAAGRPGPGRPLK